MGSLSESYSSTRRQLDDLGYREAFSIDSLALVSRLVLDLLKATQNLQKYFQEYEVYKEIAKELQDGVEPFKTENLRLIKENSQLRLEIQRCQENAVVKLQDSKSRLRDLESENIELKSLVSQFVERVKQQDMELAKSRKITQLKEKNAGNVIVRDGEKNCILVQGQKIEVDDPAAPKLCPHCTNIRNFVRCGLKHGDPIPIDYIKVADSRIEALTLQNRNLKATQQDLMELIKSMKLGIEMKESELDKFKFDTKLVVPSIRPVDGVERIVACGDHDIENYEARDLRTALKSAQLHLQVLQKRNLNLERRLQHNFLLKPDFMSHGHRSATERQLLASTFDDNGDYIFLPNDNATMDEKLRLLEAQLSHCCREKAKLKALLQECESRHQRRRTTPERDHHPNDDHRTGNNNLLVTKKTDKDPTVLPSGSHQQTSSKKISTFIQNHQNQSTTDSKKLTTTLKLGQSVKPSKQSSRFIPRVKTTVAKVQNRHKSKLEARKIHPGHLDKGNVYSEKNGLRSQVASRKIFLMESTKIVSRPLSSVSQSAKHQEKRPVSMQNLNSDDEEAEEFDESLKETIGQPFRLRGEYDGDMHKKASSKKKSNAEFSKQDGKQPVRGKTVEAQMQHQKQNQQKSKTQPLPTQYLSSDHEDEYFQEEEELSTEVPRAKLSKQKSQTGAGKIFPSNQGKGGEYAGKDGTRSQGVSRHKISAESSRAVSQPVSSVSQSATAQENEDSLKEMTGQPFSLRGEYDVDIQNRTPSKRKSHSEFSSKEDARFAAKKDAHPEAKKGSRPDVCSRPVGDKIQPQKQKSRTQPLSIQPLHSDNEDDGDEDFQNKKSLKESSGQPFQLRGEYDGYKEQMTGFQKKSKPKLSKQSRSTSRDKPTDTQSQQQQKARKAQSLSTQQLDSDVEEFEDVGHEESFKDTHRGVDHDQEVEEEEFEDFEYEDSLKEISGQSFSLRGEYDVDMEKRGTSSKKKSNTEFSSKEDARLAAKRDGRHDAKKDGRPDAKKDVHPEERRKDSRPDVRGKLMDDRIQHQKQKSRTQPIQPLHSDNEEDEDIQDNKEISGQPFRLRGEYDGYKEQTTGFQKKSKPKLSKQSRSTSRDKPTDTQSQQQKARKAQSLATQQLNSDVEEFEDVGHEESFKGTRQPYGESTQPQASTSRGPKKQDSNDISSFKPSTFPQDPYQVNPSSYQGGGYPTYPTENIENQKMVDSKMSSKDKRDDTIMDRRAKESPPRMSSFKVPTVPHKVQNPYQASSKSLHGGYPTETEYPGRYGTSSKVSTPWSAGYGRAPEGSRNREDEFPEPEHHQPYSSTMGGRASPQLTDPYSRTVGYRPYSQNVDSADSREMQQRIRSLERIIDNMKMKASVVDASKSDLENEVLKLRRALAECQDHGQQLKSEVQKAKIMLEQTEALLKDTQRKAAANYVPAQRENQELTAQVRQLMAKEMVLEREVSTLTATVKAIDRDKDEMRVELDRKDEKLARMQAESAKHFDDISKFQLQLKNAELQSSHAGEAFREQERELTLLRREREDLKRELEKKVRERDLAQRELTVLNQFTSKRELEKRHMTEELEKRGKESDDLRKQVQKYLDEVRRIEELLLKKDEEMEILMDNYRHLTQEKGALESQRNILERQSSSARALDREVLDSNLALSNKIASQADLIHSYEEEISNLSGQVATLENQLRTLRDTEKLLRVDVKAARDLSLKLETKLDSMRLEVANCESAKNKLEAENAELHASMGLMGSQLTSDEEKQKKMEDLLMKMRENQYQAEQVNAGITSERDLLVSRLATINSRTEQLSAEAERYRLRAAELQNELEKFKRQYQHEKIEKETALAEFKKLQAQLSNTSTSLLMSSALAPSRTPSPHFSSGQQGSTLLPPDLSPVGQSSRDTLIPSPLPDQQYHQ